MRQRDRMSAKGAKRSSTIGAANDGIADKAGLYQGSMVDHAAFGVAVIEPNCVVPCRNAVNSSQ